MRKLIAILLMLLLPITSFAATAEYHSWDNVIVLDSWWEVMPDSGKASDFQIEVSLPGNTIYTYDNGLLEIHFVYSNENEFAHSACNNMGNQVIGEIKFNHDIPEGCIDVEKRIQVINYEYMDNEFHYIKDYGSIFSFLYLTNELEDSYEIKAINDNVILYEFKLKYDDGHVEYKYLYLKYYNDVSKDTILYINKSLLNAEHEEYKYLTDEHDHVVYCPDCKEELSREEHLFNSYKTIVSPTCEMYGIKQRSCTICGYKDEIVLPKIEHRYISEVIKSKWFKQGYTKHTCITCGYEYNNDYQKTKWQIFFNK